MLALCCCHYAHSRAQDHGSHLCLGQDGVTGAVRAVLLSPCLPAPPLIAVLTRHRQKSEDDSKLASRKYARIIQKLGFNAKFTDFKIQNIVGSCDIKFPIRPRGPGLAPPQLQLVRARALPRSHLPHAQAKVVLLIFVSGKIVLTGAKVREEIYQAFEMIYPVLQGGLSSPPSPAALAGGRRVWLTLSVLDFRKV